MAAAVLSSGIPASAQMAVPAPLDTPLPEKWHTPVERFLTELRVADVREVLKATKADLAGAISNDTIILRLEHAQLCAQDMCITVIGEIKAGEFHPHVMFAAGKMVTHADSLGTHPGVATSSEILFLRSSAGPSSGDVVVVETAKGLIVAPIVRPSDDANSPQK
jgi:hypothetical protein